MKSNGFHQNFQTGLSDREPVAVVGIGCRFPGGADTPARFWELLSRGAHGVREMDRWTTGAANGLPRWGATLDHIDQFDAEFFGIPALEAAAMDPQQRLLLEVVWEALENAGQPVDALAGSRSGVFVGIYNADYAWEQNATGVPDSVYSGVGSGGAIAANRLSYLLDLRGPSIAIDTTCSSSLVAAHLAVGSLRRHESDLAIAAGVNLTFSPTVAKSVCAVVPMAADGFCKSFDSRADGIVRGEACAALLLRRLSDAEANGDPILALIVGSAVNQDGKSNGFTAPSLVAQEEVIQAAFANAQVPPSSISYVEAHGTGTALGDPIEWEALDRVIGRARENGRCLVGSVKANIGHCEAAAGVAGMIKAVLSLQNRRIPMQPHFQSPNPRLASYGDKLIVPSTTTAWSGRQPRRAGVSSFSIGGTNAHVVLEEAPAQASAIMDALSTPRLHVLPISARSSEALHRLIDAYLKLLDTDVSIHDLCYSAARRRTHYAMRIAASGNSAAEFKASLIARLSIPRATAENPIAESYERGENPDWQAIYPRGNFIPLPNYPWQRQRHWFAPAETRLPDPTTDGPAKFIYQVDWVDTKTHSGANLQSVDLPSVEQAMSAALPSLSDKSGFSEYRKLAPVLEDRAGRAIEAALYTAGWRPAEGSTFSAADLRTALRVLPQYERLCARVIDVLAEDGVLKPAEAGEWTVLRPLRDFDWPNSAEAGGAEAALLRRCTSRFCETLRGECNALELLFPSGDMQQAEALFADSPFAKLFNALAARAFDAIVPSASRPSPIRVLEIGAGTGGTTAALLNACPSERTQYVFTDVSPAFFKRARERFAAYPFLSYRQLDIEIEPGKQGFEGQQFDIVVAANVLHATADLRASLKNVKSLLAPGGILLLIESTARHRLTDFTYGLTPGWWKFADTDLRSLHPMLPAEAWLKLLSNCGFESAVATPGEYGASVILANMPAEPGESAGPPGRWIVIGQAQCANALRDSLESHGGCAKTIESAEQLEAHLSTGDCAGVVYLGGVEATCCEADSGAQVLEGAVEVCRDLITTAQVLGKHSEGRTRLWLLTRRTRGSPPELLNAPLNAIGAVIAREYPAIWGGSIDVHQEFPNDDSDRIADTILESRAPGDWSIRSGRVLTRVIQSATLPKRAAPLRFEGRGSYLITGGFGGMGLRVAEWMSQRGAGKLVLIGRRGLLPENRMAIEQMERRGTAVECDAVNVADEPAMRTLLGRIRRSGFPLRGIIHAAGIFEDQLLARHDWDYFRRVFLSKAVGAWNLHRLTSHCSLDHFAMFSSAARYLDPTGLANYAAANAFLDALAEYRRSRSLPAISIAWAGWTGTGMAGALPQRRVEEWERSGVRSLDPEAGLQVLEILLRGGGGPALAIVMDREQHANPTMPPDVAGKLAELAGRPIPQRTRIVSSHVEAEVSRIMDAGGVAPVGHDVPLADLGFDSLMSLELRNVLGSTLGVDLPAAFAFDYPTIDAITRRLLELLYPDSAPVVESDASTTAQMNSLVRELNSLSDDDVQEQLEQYARTLLHTP